MPEQRRLAERQPGEQVNHERVDRIAWGVGDAEVGAGHQEQAVVFEHHGAWEGGGVEGEGTEHRRGQRGEVGPAGGERRWRPRRRARGPADGEQRRRPLRRVRGLDCARGSGARGPRPACDAPEPATPALGRHPLVRHPRSVRHTTCA